MRLRDGRNKAKALFFSVTLFSFGLAFRSMAALTVPGNSESSLHPARDFLRRDGGAHCTPCLVLVLVDSFTRVYNTERLFMNTLCMLSPTDWATPRG